MIIPTLTTELARERIKQVALISGSHGVLSRLDKEQNKWKQQIKTISDLNHSLQQKFVWVIHEDKNKSLDKRKEFEDRKIQCQENREDVQGKKKVFLISLNIGRIRIHFSPG